MIKTHEWTQQEWSQPAADLYKNLGDFYEMNGLYLDPTRRYLRRAPPLDVDSVSTPSATELPIALFFDATNERYVTIVKNGTTSLILYYWNTSWSRTGPYTLTSAVYDLGGLDGRNVKYWGGALWLIGSDGNIYRGTDYTSTLTAIYSGGDAECLAPMGAYMYAALDDGEIIKLTTSASSSHYDPTHPLTPLYLAPFRGYLLFVAAGDDTTLYFYRITDSVAPTMQQIAEIPNASLDYPGAGCLFAQYDDRIFFSTGRSPTHSGTKHTDVYVFDGSSIEHLARITDNSSNYVSSGLLQWDDELLFYGLTGESITAAYTIKVLTGSGFTDLNSTTLSAVGITPRLFSLNGRIIATGKVTAHSPDIWYTSDALIETAYVTSSRLHFNQPATPKRLESITAIAGGEINAVTEVEIYYRTDDNTNWTKLTEEANTRIVTSGAIGETFYTLQIKTQIDDSGEGANTNDVTINAVSVIYSTNK